MSDAAAFGAGVAILFGVGYGYCIKMIRTNEQREARRNLRWHQKIAYDLIPWPFDTQYLKGVSEKYRKMEREDLKTHLGDF